MPNLAHESTAPQGQVVRFPRKERQTMTGKDEGYTKLPNLLIDTEIMAHLSDKAFKCLMFIVRQTVGFGRTSHTISITQFQKYCGIKKRDTVIAAIQSLEDVKIIQVKRKLGCLSRYSVTLDQYQQSGLVPTIGTSTTEQDGTSTTEQDCTSPTKQDTNKENFKENLNKEKKVFSVDNLKSDVDIFSDSIQYHADDQRVCTLKELSTRYTVQVDFKEHAKKLKPELTDDKIIAELKNFAQWSIGQEPRTAQNWMNNWIYRIERISAVQTTTSKTKQLVLSESQITTFASKLANHHAFASQHANIGETTQQFINRISSKLREPAMVKKWGEYLNDVGFKQQTGA